MVHRPTIIREQDTVEIRLTKEAEYRLPFTFIEALKEGTLFDRPAHFFRDAARQHRLLHVVNRATETFSAPESFNWHRADTNRPPRPRSAAGFVPLEVRPPGLRPDHAIGRSRGYWGDS
jgi:hypothetical protein